MKRFFGISLILLIMLLFMPSAHAEEVKVSITATPTELTEGGTVDFSFDIANYNTDYPIQDVTITYLGTSFDVLSGGEIPPSGSALGIVLTLDVSESQLDNPIVFTVAWTINGEPMSEDASITILRAEDPVITVARTADRETAEQGDEIVLTYVITNNTKFDMTDIMLIDENISDNPILQHDTLRASGSSSINYSYIMGDESVVSTPFVTYTVNGKTKTYSSVEPLTLTMVLVRLGMEIDMGAPTVSGVNFTFDISNTGSQEITNIQVADERANLVNTELFSLEPGESTTLSFLVVPIMTEPLRNVKFTLTGVDPFGETYTLASDETYEVYPFVDDSEISVSVRAETVTAWTAETRSVTARIVLTNYSTVELTKVSILESGVVIKTIELLPAGETTFDQEIVLGSPRNLSFTVKGYDPTGANRELASCVLPVAYSAATAETAQVTAAPSGGSLSLFSGVSSAITKILIALGVLMVLSFVVLIALTVMERARSPFGLDDDDEDDDIDDYGGDGPHDSGYGREHVHRADENEYRGAMKPDEVSYTKRMLAIKDGAERKNQAEKPAPILLPPVSAPPKEQVRLEYEDAGRSAAEAPVRTRPTRQPAADAAAQNRETQRVEPVSEARYRPAYPPKEQGAVQEKQPARSSQPPTPKVYEYRRRPAPQPVRRGGVVHVEHRQNAKGEPNRENPDRE